MSRKKPIAIEAEDTDLPERDRPRKQERDLEIENDEKDGDEVVPHVELHAGVFVGLEAALVRRDLLRAAWAARQHTADAGAEKEQEHREPGADDEENQDGKVVREHDSFRSTTGGPQ